MRWDIAPKTRCDLLVFSGINLAGRRQIARVHPYGGLQGDTLDEGTFQSLIVVAPIGTRVTLMTTVAEEGWEERPWRTIEITREDAFRTKEGKWAVRVPQLNCLDAPNAQRTDPDFEIGFPQADDVESGTGWTYGRGGGVAGQVRAIKVDKRPRTD